MKPLSPAPSPSKVQECGLSDQAGAPGLAPGGIDTKTQPYNTLSISRQCASCLGFAPQILSQIKLACLSYTNSPVTYADGITLSTHDLLRVKEMLLKKLELQNANMSEFLTEFRSNYGAIGELEVLQRGGASA